MSVGVLTGRPAEEMLGSTGDQLPELLQLHERVRQTMSSVAQALWPSVSLLEGLGELAEKLQGARRRFPVVEGISLPTRCKGSLGHGEDAVQEGGSKPHGRGQTCGARWEGDPCELSVRPGRASRQIFPIGL